MKENLIFNSKTKHASIKYYFLREVIGNKDIEFEYCRTKEQLADIFTKAHSRFKFKALRDQLGVSVKCIKEKC